MKKITVENQAYPFMFQIANWGASLSRALGLPFTNIQRASIERGARRQAKLSDTGPDDWGPTLDILLSDVESAGFTPLAYAGLRALCVRALVTRMRLVDYLKSTPMARNAHIERPIFVLGFPRSGTTVLQNLLSLDPSRRGLEFWELTNPLPLHTNPARDEEKRRKDSDFMLQVARSISPEMDAIHEVRVDSLEECWPLFYPSFSVLNYDLQSGLPNFYNHLMGCDMTPSYGLYRDFLKAIMHQRPCENLVLKCPEHLWFLDALLEVFPDACIVWTHRDPLASIASYCSLISLNRRMCYGRIDHHHIGTDIAHRFEDGIRRALATRQRVGEANFFDVHFHDLVNNHEGVIRAITEHFDLPLADNAGQAIQGWLNTRRADTRGKHQYSAELYGLSPADIDARFSEYLARFEIPIRRAS